MILASINVVKRVRLTRKLATMLDGVDVSALEIGDIVELPDNAARILIAERWAEPLTDPAINQVFVRNRPPADTPTN